MRTIIGIDFGTSNSVIAYADRSGRPQVLMNLDGERSTPSVVAWSQDESAEVLVGSAALREMGISQRAVAEVKRQMGRLDPITVGTQRLTPVEIAAIILRKLRTDAERRLNRPIEEAVITVPANFSDQARRNTEAAGAFAGFKKVYLYIEPTAAATAYGFTDRPIGHVLVYDLGGGTFDVSVVHVSQTAIHVKATDGDEHLGGADFDQALLKYVIDKANLGSDYRQDGMLVEHLHREVQQAKHALSTSQQVRFLIPGQTMWTVEITRREFEHLIEDHLQRTRVCITRALEAAKLKKSDLQHVLLIGGSTFIPRVSTLIKEWLGIVPHHGLSPVEAVAMGAAIEANSILNKDAPTHVVHQTLGYALGIEAIIGNVSQGFSQVIPANSPFPIEASGSYRTSKDNQTSVRIRVFQGTGTARQVDEPEMVLLKEFMLENIPPRPAGQEGLTVTFAYDANGIVQVKARLLSTGQEATATIDKLATFSAAAIEEGRVKVEGIFLAPSDAVILRANDHLSSLRGPKREALQQVLDAHNAARKSGSAVRITDTLRELTDNLATLLDESAAGRQEDGRVKQ